MIDAILPVLVPPHNVNRLDALRGGILDDALADRRQSAVLNQDAARGGAHLAHKVERELALGVRRVEGDLGRLGRDERHGEGGGSTATPASARSTATTVTCEEPAPYDRSELATPPAARGGGSNMAAAPHPHLPLATTTTLRWMSAAGELAGAERVLEELALDCCLMEQVVPLALQVAAVQLVLLVMWL